MSAVDKRDARRRGLAARRRLTCLQRQEKSAAAVGRLLADRLFHDAEAVFCYVSVEDEVHTDEIIRAALAGGKRVAVPFITSASRGMMCAARLYSADDLTAGEYGIWTVPPENVVPVAPAELELAVVPGSAFDRAGRRVGMGGGYYDRFLRQAEGAVRAAAAYECQLFSRIETEKHDLAMDYIFTEAAVYKI